MTITSHSEPIIKQVLLKGLAAILLLATSLPGQTVGTKDVTVTATGGESWLKHLHRSFNETSMGRTWDMGPPAPTPQEESSHRQPEQTPGFATNIVTVHGSDLYCLNCQGCHGASGAGVPPEINSIT